MLASYIQYPSFWEQIFSKLIIMCKHFLTWRRTKKRSLILQSRFLQDIIEIIQIFLTKSWPIVYFPCKHRRTSFRLNVVNKKLTWTPAKNYLFLLQCQISSLRTVIVYENFIFTREYTFAERCCFLTFSFEGKFRKYYISVKRKQTKTNENMIFSVMFINFCQKEVFWFP